eukprot:3499255-Prorocentrum_lima.AAC.1
MNGTGSQGKEVPKKSQVVHISGLLGGGMSRDESDDPHRKPEINNHDARMRLSLIHISEPTRLDVI